MVLQKQDIHSVPRDIVERAILKDSIIEWAIGRSLYEAYGPAGSAFDYQNADF